MLKLQRGGGLFWLVSAVLFVLFLGLIAAVLWIDVAPIGPLESEIGLSGLNAWARDGIGACEICYEISELLGYLSIATVGVIGVIGLVQWIRRKSLFALDHDLFCAAGAYVLFAALYVFFEIVVINYRPVLEEGALAASFPSSHTMLVICLAGIAGHQLATRVTLPVWRVLCVTLSSAVILVTVVGRLLSGVHWLTDILGGVLLGGAILFAYFGAVKAVKK